MHWSVASLAKAGFVPGPELTGDTDSIGKVFDPENPLDSLVPSGDPNRIASSPLGATFPPPPGNQAPGDQQPPPGQADATAGPQAAMSGQSATASVVEPVAISVI